MKIVMYLVQSMPLLYNLILLDIGGSSLTSKQVTYSAK